GLHKQKTETMPPCSRIGGSLERRPSQNRLSGSTCSVRRGSQDSDCYVTCLPRDAKSEAHRVTLSHCADRHSLISTKIQKSASIIHRKPCRRSLGEKLAFLAPKNTFIT